MLLNYKNLKKPRSMYSCYLRTYITLVVMGLFMPVLTFENISSKTKRQANFIDYLSQQCPSNQRSNHLSLVICDLFSNSPKASLQTFKQAKQTVIINTKDHAIDLRLQLQDKKRKYLPSSSLPHHLINQTLTT